MKKIDSLSARLAEVAKKTKRTKHKAIRDLLVSRIALCKPSSTHIFRQR
ncbi:hypothetical protein AB9K33_26610 [Citrobacter freundii]